MDMWYDRFKINSDKWCAEATKGTKEFFRHNIVHVFKILQHPRSDGIDPKSDQGHTS